MITRDSAHNYSTDAAPGRIFPSVTTITGEWSGDGMVPWARRHAIDYVLEHLPSGVTEVTGGLLETRITQDALREANLGTLVHSTIEAIIKDEDWAGYEDTAPFIRAFNRFVKAEKPKWVFSELPIINVEERFGGTVDAGALVVSDEEQHPRDDPSWQHHHRESLTVIDFKTSKRTWREHIMQVAAYAMTLKEQGHPVEQGAILQLRPDRYDWKIIDLPRLKRAYRAFLALRDAYEWQLEEGAL